jgi:SnoaL-like protein
LPSHPFAAAVGAGDWAGALATLSPDVVLNSPVSFKPFEGKDAVGELFAVLSEVFEDFHYTDELAGDLHGLVFRARVGDKQVQGIDLLRHDDDGQVAEITVMVRPLSAAIALAEAVGPRLAARAQGSAA